ncbi:MFS transporter [Luteimonas aquatica]|uniref:MFS transporter n=1 Tax=Luteimonas aquatica TaxID=450364 RepID=UPI001F59DB2E|nr:MFS transporter [Luteimonas aquatica]
MTATATAASMTPARRLRSIFSGSAGNLVEWYDWLAYSSFAIYFAPHFFPKGDRNLELLNSAAVFAVGFLMRPIGGWLMGLFADRYGRRTALVWSVLLMCSGSLLIAICPGYERIGVAAPILLVLARLIQGVSLGGEYGTSATYLSEMADKRHRGFWSSFQYVTMVLGQLIALLVLIVMQRWLLTEEQLNAWGWRIPFVIGALLGVTVMFLRRTMQETESFHAVARSDRPKASIRELMKYPREVLTVIGLTLGGTISYYTYTTYPQKFLVNSAGFSKAQATQISALSLIVFIFLQPLFGALSDRIGRRPLLIAFGVLGTLLSYTILSGIAASTTTQAALAWVVAGLAVTSFYTSINAVVKAELFPAHIRALGVGLPYALTLAIFGGTAELIALWFKQIGHEPWFYWYVTGCTALSLLVYATMRDTKHHSRIDRDHEPA